jgi:hypothetical protein
MHENFHPTTKSLSAPWAIDAVFYVDLFPRIHFSLWFHDKRENSLINFPFFSFLWIFLWTRKVKEKNSFSLNSRDLFLFELFQCILCRLTAKMCWRNFTRISIEDFTFYRETQKSENKDIKKVKENFLSWIEIYSWKWNKTKRKK